MMSVMYADTVILNGSVLTVNQQDDVTEAVAIRDGKILAVGSNSVSYTHLDVYKRQ